MKYLYKIIVVLYLIVGIVPNFESIDKVATQWLYLNTLNTICLATFLFLKIDLKKYFLNKSSQLFISLFLWSVLSIFFAINKVESIVVLSQYFSLTIGFVVLLMCFSKIKNSFNFLSAIISIYLIAELIRIYLPFTNSNFDYNLIFQRSSYFLGFAANVNITAFSILYKIPFFIYTIFNIKRIKTVGLIFLSLILFSLVFFASGTLNSTRGAILTYSLLSPILLILSFRVYYKLKKNRLLVISLSYTLALGASFAINSSISKYLNQSESNLSNRVSTLISLVDEEKKADESINQRLNFYSQALNHIIENPFFGAGIGNWKIKSIDTNKKNIVGYQVPYHVHNDFLELAAELGLIGLGIYLLLLYTGFKKVILNTWNIIFSKKNLVQNYGIWITTLLYLTVFLIDSNLNFPFSRPIVIIILIIMLAFLASNKEFQTNEK
jgi:O-antigen ligase